MKLTLTFIKMSFFAFTLSTVVVSAEKLYDSICFTGYGALQIGQLVRGYYNAPYSQVSQNHDNHLIHHQWIESLRSRLTGSFYKGWALKINLGIEFNYNFFTIFNPGPNPDNIKTLTPLTYYHDLLIHRADMEYIFCVLENRSFGLKLGYFPFKYNPQAANLGEYLFRSECYPNHLVNEFYFAEARLLGANLTGTLSGKSAGLRGDILFTSETTYPAQDFSATGLVNAGLFNKAVELGAGVQFQRLIPVDPARTTPHTLRNICSVDTMTGDTSYYSFSGIKFMGRWCFDIKKALPIGIFGEEDLKLYGEAAVLGLKNYDSLYKNLSERIPVMLGFNIPTFKLLEVAAFEIEYYSSPYFNNNRNQIYPNIDNYPPATPYIIPDQDVNGGHGVTKVTDKRLKWSVFIKKTLTTNFRIVAQVARDHSRFQDPMHRQTYYTYDGDVTIAAKDWYYLIRLMWCF